MRRSLVLDEAGIVLMGSFNPALFQPAWLAAKGLIREAEAENASELVVTGQVTSFTTGWLNLQVTRDRFASRAGAAHFEALRDLVAGILLLLEHTPIKAMGLNHMALYELESEATWHALGDRLAPKEPWADLLPGGPRRRPGMRSLVILGNRPDCSANTTQVKVESTPKPSGIHFDTNDHYEGLGEPDTTAAAYLGTLRSSWEGAMAFGKRAADHILDQVPD